MFDSLELELPGLPGDGWTISISAGAVSIHSITAVVSAAAYAPPRVRIRPELQQKEREQMLEVRRGGMNWHYMLQSSSVSPC
jgi:hypothetical protein